MTPKEPKRQKPRKTKPSEAGVMGSLSSERPARIGGRRDSSAPTAQPPVASGAGKRPAKAVAVPKTLATAAPAAAEKPPSARTAPAAAEKPPSARTAPTIAAKPTKAKTARKPPTAGTAAAPKPPRAKTATTPKPPRAQPEGPTPIRAGAPELDDAAPPSAARTSRIPAGAPRSGTELASTVVHAAGELAQIGLTVGGQVLKRAVRRLPGR